MMINPDLYFDIPLESHEVQTNDGYILTLKRIPGCLPVPENGFDKKEMLNPKPAVLLVHGLHCSGTDWLLNKLEKTLPHKLVVEGYDCWLASNRGTKLSRGHTTLSTNSRKYWDFSLDDIALDTTVLIDYILSTTGNKTLYYVGHSLGCTQLFVAVNLKPEYISKIETMIALCPAVYGKHIRNIPLNAGKPFGALLGKSKMFYRTVGELFPKTSYEYAKRVCFPMKKPDKFGIWLLKKSGSFVGAFGTEQVEKERLLTISQHLPSPTSMKMYCHIAQCFKAGRLQQYDDGRSRNMKKYGQAKPLSYSLQNVTFPVATITSEYDLLITAKDVAQVAKELPNLIQHHEIRIINSKFNHADFMIGNTADVLVYDRIIDIFHLHNNSMHLSTNL